MSDSLHGSTPLIEKTIPGLHDSLLKQFKNYVAQPSNILDLAAGSGAWVSRLQSLGYSVTAADINKNDFAATGIKFIQTDLNRDFGENLGGPYDAVTAIEIIEHLENPRHFLRQCKTLLKPGGILFVTTPNIECVPGRLRFLLTGNFRMFDKDPLFNEMTHITPLQTYMFQKMIDECNFSLVSSSFNAEGAHVSHPFYRLISVLIKPLLRGVTGGDIHIFVLQNKLENDKGN